MTKQTKKAKMIAYFKANPNAKPKDVAAKFGVAMPTIYQMRKQALNGWKVIATVTSDTPVPDEVKAPDARISELVFEASQGRNRTADMEQQGGDHYLNMTVQPWAAMEAWMSREAFAGFLRGNSIKYLARADKKGGLEDLLKARHYIDKLIEVTGGNA